jgi:hypothetical protein
MEPPDDTKNLYQVTKSQFSYLLFYVDSVTKQVIMGSSRLR